MQPLTGRGLHSKSRNGCLRCKAKKTKCDERKPSCSRCESRGFQCPGYALNVRWSQKHQSQADRAACRGGLGSARNPGLPASRFQASCTASQQMHDDSMLFAVASDDTGEASGNSLHSDSLLHSPPEWDLAMSDQLFDFQAVSHDSFLNEEQSAAMSLNPFLDSTSVESTWSTNGDSPIAARSVATLLSTGHEETPDGGVALATGVENASASATTNFQSPRQSHSALLDAVARRSPSPIRELLHMPTALSDHFFREVITLYCTWDSKSNTMRNIVENKWQASGVLYHTIQSMAAACLSEDFPHLSPIAVKEHSLAVQYIQDNSPSSEPNEEKLLASTMLGHTASWLNPHNLATDMFRASCDMVKGLQSDKGNQECISFFSDTMDYWAMLLVYLTDRKNLGSYDIDIPVVGTRPADPPQAIEPHPYSGLSRETVKLLTEVGILIFQYRKHISAVKFITEEDLDVFRQSLRDARRLERRLMAHRTPELSLVKDPGDPKTSLAHLRLIDEAYRCTGLLQLYRVFPDLLSERYAPWDKEHILRPAPAERVPSAQERQVWLTRLAIHILALLRDIPFESRARSVQPFIMVASSSELRYESGDQGLDGLGLSEFSIEVVRARKFVRSRLAAYTHILPLRKIRVIFELIRCIWSAIDAGEKDVYWLDMAYEKQLGTMMG